MAGVFRFINTTVPTRGCNLRCEYCYVRQHGDEEQLKISGDNNAYRYSIEHMLAALTVERMGGVCMFNLSADGETLLSPFLFEIVTGLLDNGHFVALISNCTVTSEINRYCSLDKSMRAHLFFKASFHYRELKKRGLLDVYANNINLLKENGISFSVELVSNDYILDEIEEVKEFSVSKFGALPHVLGGREETIKGKYPKYKTKLSEDDFYKIWGAFDSPLFEFQEKEYLKQHNQDFCYAGVYTGTLDMSSGEFSACPGNRTITNFFENVDEPIQFLPMGNMCPFPFCFCGFFLQVLAGSCIDTYDSGYKFFEFRDRLCDDGTHWLTPSIKEAFSHTCAEYHDRVSEEQAFLINEILNVVYHGFNGVVHPRLRAIFGAYWKELKTRNVAVYGISDLGKMLVVALNESGIEIQCGIDRRYNEIQSNIPLVSPNKIPRNVDTVIVTAYNYYPYIKKFLLEKYPEIMIYSILDVLLDSF